MVVVNVVRSGWEGGDDEKTDDIDNSADDEQSDRHLLDDPA